MSSLGLFIAAMCLQSWQSLACAGGFAVVVFWPLLSHERNKSSEG